MASFITDTTREKLKIKSGRLQVGPWTWNIALWWHLKTNRRIWICTYSLPDMHYIEKVLGKRPWGITLLANYRFLERAEEIKLAYPEIEVFLHYTVHAKFALVEPKTVILSSANFGNSDWTEWTVTLHSEDAFRFCLAEFRKILSQAVVVKF